MLEAHEEQAVAMLARLLYDEVNGHISDPKNSMEAVLTLLCNQDIKYGLLNSTVVVTKC